MAALSDDCQYGRAIANDFVQVPPKISSQGNRIHVLEDKRLAKFGDESVIDPSRGIRIVTAAMADENPGQEGDSKLLTVGSSSLA